MKDSTVPTNCENGGEKLPPNNEKENMEVSPKVNVFQFMMNNRHKSIGTNSTGRELDLNQSTETILSKKSLKERKSRLESWADEKGASKRKREYEEIGNCIDYKIEARGKKLKKMLKIGCENDEVVTKKKKKKCAVIETDSETSNDAKVVAEDEQNENNDVKVGAENKQNEEKKNKKRSKSRGKSDDEINFSPRTVRSWKFKIKLSMEQHNGNDSSNLDSVENEVVSEPKKHEDKIENISVQNINENPKNDTSVQNINENPENDISVQNINENLSESAITVSDESPDKKTEITVTEEKRVLRSRRSKPKAYEDFFLSDDEEEDKKVKRKEKKNMKVAPVFLKAIPKPKEDPKVVEARRQFLLSGVPSSVKREMEKQQSFEEVDFDVFPLISHIQQKTSDNIFWELPKVDLKTHNIITNIELKNCTTDLLNLDQQPTKELPSLPTKLKNYKKIVREIKSQNPDYPVFKIFNSMFTKDDNQTPKVKRRGRPKKTPDKKSQPVVPTKPEDNSPFALWTEKYRAKSTLDIIGNHGAISSLKEWLKNWSRDFKRRKNDDSESEFDIDSDSRDSSRSSGNSVLLKGPTGSGKTASVYAICNELGLSVIEVNASNKRTGKRLLQELQEATQSHQVRKEDNILTSFVKETKNEETKPKMCVLLIEDIDVVFDQDEGFISALSQIMMTSKRPVILTTTDEPPNKVISNYESIEYLPLSSVVTVWLQIVCLVEGYYVQAKSIEELLSYFKGDIRRTLLQLQLYVNSGGHVSENKDTNAIQIDDEDNDIQIGDDNSDLSELKVEESSEMQLHDSCVDVDKPVKDYYCRDLGIIWWNLPTVLNLPNYANSRMDKNLKIQPQSHSKVDKTKLKMLFDCYESLAFCDIITKGGYFHESLERRWQMKVKDSLSLDDNFSFYEDTDFDEDIAETLINGRLNLFKKKYDSGTCNLNMAVPVAMEQKWRSKQLSSEEKLQEAVSLGEFLNRKSLVLDYMPFLRTMARRDCELAATSTKRKHRFHSCFKNLGIRCSDTTYKVASDIFKI